MRDGTVAYACQLGRRAQFSLHMPPKNYRATGVHATTNATVMDANTLTCATDGVVTAGNTTVCILAANTSSTQRDTIHTNSDHSNHPRTTSYTSKVLCDGSNRWAPRFVEHFPLFAPAFSRRPYFREDAGAIIAELDLASLSGLSVTLTVEVESGKPPVINHTFTVGDVRFIRIPFSFHGMAADVNIDALLTLVSPYYPPAYHVRKFSRSRPPPNTTSVTTFQVDHERKALLKDGVAFIMSGWFAGGYSHESAGLPPSHFVAPQEDASGSNADLLSALGQASLTTEWGRHGVTFIRAGSWTNSTLATLFLDAAAAAGVSVLW